MSSCLEIQYNYGFAKILISIAECHFEHLINYLIDSINVCESMCNMVCGLWGTTIKINATFKPVKDDLWKSIFQS